MHFKRLEIQGFKTFASRTVLEFRPGITAVVGPNGSGKSNVADAVRWVLGEQSYAALRCKRTEELLFSGGGRRAPSGLAEVSLTLDNSDRLLPLAFDEVTFTRRATRAGENEYFINRARVRLRDVQQATEPLGGSYTIINQGLVDTALTLRPEERRRLFEDAAEIGGFESRKAETERRLRETDGNLNRLGDLVAELEPRLRSLKRQAAQARQQRELSGELHTLLVAHYAALWRAAREALALAQEQAAASGVALEHARTAQSAAAAELQALRGALRELRERAGELGRQRGLLQQQAEAAQRELAVNDERAAALGRRIGDAERAQNELALREDEASRELAATRESLAMAELALAEQRALVQAQEHALAQNEAERRVLARAVIQAQDATLKTAARLAEQRSRAEQLARQRERLLAEQAGHEAATAQALARTAHLQSAVVAAQLALETAHAALLAAQQGEDTARAAAESLRRQRATAAEALAAARRALADVEARQDSLERLARSYAGAFAGVKAAMQWAQQHNRHGFVLVASIVRAPSQLETAIEVALGSRLQHIVVEHWQDAEEAIAELKRSGVGRATFLPLDTIRPATDGGRRSTDGSSESVLGVAAELVEYDEGYRDVVQQLLGRTLVVRDLPTARQELRRLGGGWLLVTLAGEQISSGGAVTGGAQVRESGALRRERELRDLPRQVEAARQAVAAAEQSRRALDAELAAADQELRSAEALRRERAPEAEAGRGTLDNAQRAAARAEQELGWQHSRSEVAERDLMALDEQQRGLVATQAAAEAAVAAAQGQLAAARSDQERHSSGWSEAQRQLATLRATMAEGSGRASAGRTLAAGQQQALERLAQQRQQGTQRLEELATELVALEAQRAAAEGRHADLFQQLAQLQALIVPAEAQLAAHEAHLATLEQHDTASTDALVHQEADHSRADLEFQRARDRLETLGERAAADGVAELSGDEAGGEGEHGPTPDHQTIQQLRDRIARLGSVNPLALEEYEQTAERHSFLAGQIADLQEARQVLRELIGDLEAAMQAQFSETFQAVAAEFERSFTLLFGGGEARLQLVGGTAAEADASSPEGQNDSEVLNKHMGVEIVARPPGKRSQNLSLLSGGERTLTAAALLFAILKINPSPFCILDEVDAALDESNVGRFREALLRLTGQTQFIVITHNRGTIEAADTLYGISMGPDSASQVLSLRIEELA